MATRFIELAGEINANMPAYVVQQVTDALNELSKSVRGSQIAILGVAYKKDVDDPRESPSFRLMELLQQKGARISYNDPHIPRLPLMRHYDVPRLESQPLTAQYLADQDCVLIATDHSTYDWPFIVRHASLVVDTRNATQAVTEGRKRSAWRDAPFPPDRKAVRTCPDSNVSSSPAGRGSWVRTCLKGSSVPAMTSSAWTTSSPARRRNVAHLLGQPNFELLRHDITIPIWLEVDEIYNLACPAAPGHYQYNPIKTIKTSVMGSINVLGMAKRCRAKVLQASTSEVYGDPELHPQPESYRGNVSPDRTAGLLRRGQTRRRDPVHGLPPDEQRPGADRADF